LGNQWNIAPGDNLTVTIFGPNGSGSASYNIQVSSSGTTASSPNPYIGPITVYINGFQASLSFANLTPTTNGYQQNVYITGESIDWGDGLGYQNITTGATGATYNYSKVGTYTATVKVGNSLYAVNTESTTITITQPETIPTWYCLGSGIGSSQGVCNVLGNVGYQPYPIDPNATFYSAGSTGLMLTKIASGGTYLDYDLLYAFYSGSDYYDMQMPGIWFPVSYTNAAEVNAALNEIVSAYASTYNTWINFAKNSGSAMSAIQALYNQALQSYGFITSNTSVTITATAMPTAPNTQ
jgi:hypothetical protein